MTKHISRALESAQPITCRRRVRLMKVDNADHQAVARARAMIRLLYKGNRRTVRRNVRFRELEIVFAHAWRGTGLPDDDAVRDCLYIAACHLCRQAWRAAAAGAR